MTGDLLTFLWLQGKVWASLVAQSVKNPPAIQEIRFQSGLIRSPGEGKSNLLQYSFLEIPRILLPQLHSANTFLEASLFLCVLCLIPRRIFPHGPVWWKSLLFQELALTLLITNILGALFRVPVAPCIHFQSLNSRLSDVLKPGTQTYSF